MALEGPGRRQNEQPLTCSNNAVWTYFEGGYCDEIRIDDKIIPPSLDIRTHRFRIADELFVSMKDAVEMISEKLEEPIMEEAIATSGLERHLASMRPKPGGSILNRELNAEFLTPSVELASLRPPTHWEPLETYTGTGPFVHMGTQYAQARISVYDFPKMVSYTVRNTALQHKINVSSLTRPQDVDPRIGLIESVQLEPVSV